MTDAPKKFWMEYDAAIAQARREGWEAGRDESVSAINEQGSAFLQSWRDDHKTDQHLEGMADASDTYADVVMTLEYKEPSND